MGIFFFFWKAYVHRRSGGRVNRNNARSGRVEARRVVGPTVGAGPTRSCRLTQNLFAKPGRCSEHVRTAVSLFYMTPMCAHVCSRCDIAHGRNAART